MNSVRQWEQFNAFQSSSVQMGSQPSWLRSVLCILRIRHVGCLSWLFVCIAFLVFVAFPQTWHLHLHLYDWRLSGRAWHVLGQFPAPSPPPARPPTVSVSVCWCHYGRGKRAQTRSQRDAHTVRETERGRVCERARLCTSCSRGVVSWCRHVAEHRRTAAWFSRETQLVANGRVCAALSPEKIRLE